MRSGFLFIVVLMMALSGCLTTSGPMPNAGESTAESPLIGYWTRIVEADDRKAYEVLTVFPSDKFPERLTVIDSFGKVFEPLQAGIAQDAPDTDVYDFYISRAGGKTFVNLLDRSADVPRYIIMKCAYEPGGSLTVWNVSDDFLSKTAGQYPMLFSGGSVLNLLGKELASFVAPLKDDDYDAPAVYARWTGDVVSLKALVESGP